MIAKTNVVKFVRENVIGIDTIGRNKAGEYIARRGFFYTHGHTSQQFADRIKAQVPGATILDHGEVWKPFRGGASVAAGSHWWVRFNVEVPLPINTAGIASKGV